MSDTSMLASRAGVVFKGVLLDWRGTLVVAPTYRWLTRTALGALGRDASAASVEAVLARLEATDVTRVESSAIDTDATIHRQAYAAWFRAAGLDEDLADCLYAVESDLSLNPFARDVGPLLRTLHAAGVRIGVVSDIHVDLRPAFAQQANPDGSSWADLVDAWALSFELGVAKPDPAIFATALDQLGLPAQEVLMVGDRGAWDGAAVALGITTLLLPPLRAVGDLRLQRVVDLVMPGTAPAGH
jgi:FMN phosphatase YigB (HAD superfamily)